MKKKVDIFLWAVIWLLPVFTYLVIWCKGAGDAPDFNTFVNSGFSFAFVKDTLDSVWQAVFTSSLPISGYISYLVSVEVVHCLFDALVFIPRFAHDLIDKFSPGGIVK